MRITKDSIEQILSQNRQTLELSKHKENETGVDENKANKRRLTKWNAIQLGSHPVHLKRSDATLVESLSPGNIG